MLLRTVGTCAGESPLEHAQVGHVMELEFFPAVRRPAVARAADLITEQRFEAAANPVVVRLDDAGSSGFIDELDQTLFELSRWFKELDWIAVRIFNLNLTSAWTGFHLVSKAKAGALERADTAWQVRDSQYDAVPAARLLPLAVRHRPRT
jgi:hypothetical protein